ncbi:MULTISPECIES: DUF192 domain-containing protein [Stutzerimonas]|jgi:uncharacterized membrane protein (UPF0127 family)|uniref:Exported protein n=1 Tax=Stutzerimonas stutzeri CCUG 29243 TaxID=1196835 RepID=I4CXB5_STUST|nr:MULTISPECIES: DUF192 domain-containing protein [Stutzerimonas stutzeri subgroup]RRU71681.1 DUF192 domain-containing protein [Stutzerimonas xanthomarina]HAG78426.1 DUF192 domain-containing protein [Pseudomonas sp.]AFM34722.1 exported protein [Stutzerimonas stutzeri CCUG 29243]KKJ98193.1 hypothetical protein PK34_03100 [Stutzerimonas stutzeri]MBD3874617.1 DUF192 domain-containing protein [Stutzerimonas kunmingensis]|tara:strand:+ start:7683 stop:8099 length:417 start_codon:yes stop_codon:yes gene_type:complete
MRIALLLSLMAVATTAQPAEPLRLQLGGHQLQAEYADTFLQRQRGLMGRSELASDSGMLFRFDEVRRHCLWMKDTPLPLSAAFFDEDGVLVDVIDLEPFNTEIRCSKRPARYALEMDQGWFAEREIGRDARLEGIPEE